MEIVPRGYVVALEIQSTLMGKISEAQKTNKDISEIKERMSKGKAKGFLRMSTTLYGSRIAYMCLMTPRSGS